MLDPKILLKPRINHFCYLSRSFNNCFIFNFKKNSYPKFVIINMLNKLNKNNIFF